MKLGIDVGKVIQSAFEEARAKDMRRFRLTDRGQFDGLTFRQQEKLAIDTIRSQSETRH